MSDVRSAIVSIALLGLVAAACSPDSDVIATSNRQLPPSSVPDPPRSEPYRAAEVTAADISQFLGAYEAAFEGGDIETLQDLLSPQFIYDADPLCPFQADCRELLPFDRDTELAVMANMMDPDYSGSGPPIIERRFDYFIGPFEERYGQIIARCYLDQAIIASDTGWRLDTDFDLVFELAPGGALRLRSMKELYYIRVPGCWTSVKCLYL